MKKINLTKWLLNYAKKEKKDFYLYCFIGITMAIIWLILPILISKQTILLTANSMDTLYQITLLIFLIHFFYSISKYFISYHAQKFITSIYKNLHIDITKKFLNIKYELIHSKNTGFFIQRMTDDTIDISDFFIKITDDFIDIFINIGSLITIFLMNRILFFFYLYFLLLLFLIKKTKTKRFAEEVKKKREKVETLMNDNIELIKGVEEIKVLNLKKMFLKKIEKNILHFNKSLLNVGEVNRFFLFLSNNIKNIFRYLLLSLSIYLIYNNKLTISVALIALNYEESIFGLLDYTESLLENIKIFRLSANRILEILNDEISAKEEFGKLSLISKAKTALEFQNVSFSYENKKSLLEGISFKILETESVAFVGTSGCGKSTLFRLLTKLYQPKQGNILLFGENIENLKEEEIRNHISIVPQSPYLFAMSIEENLKGNLKITKEDLIKACKLAEIHEEILKLPNGYQTMIQENGFNLSGGQKQRLAIARSLLQNTPIILLDEATSALDNETQKKIQNNLANLKGKTIVTIAHRLSTILNHDRIVVLNHGKIDAIGTHETLLKENQIYQSLYRNEQTKSNY